MVSCFDGESQLFARIVKFAIRVNIIKLLALKLLMENCRVAKKMVKKILMQRNKLNFSINTSKNILKCFPLLRTYNSHTIHLVTWWQIRLRESRHWVGHGNVILTSSSTKPISTPCITLHTSYNLSTFFACAIQLSQLHRVLSLVYWLRHWLLMRNIIHYEFLWVRIYSHVIAILCGARDISN